MLRKLRSSSQELALAYRDLLTSKGLLSPVIDSLQSLDSAQLKKYRDAVDDAIKKKVKLDNQYDTTTKLIRQFRTSYAKALELIIKELQKEGKSITADSTTPAINNYLLIELNIYRENIDIAKIYEKFNLIAEVLYKLRNLKINDQAAYDELGREQNNLALFDTALSAFLREKNASHVADSKSETRTHNVTDEVARLLLTKAKIEAPLNRKFEKIKREAEVAEKAHDNEKFLNKMKKLSLLTDAIESIALFQKGDYSFDELAEQLAQLSSKAETKVEHVGITGWSSKTAGLLGELSQKIWHLQREMKKSLEEKQAHSDQEIEMRPKP